jgi:type II secretory pathway component PulF
MSVSDALEPGGRVFPHYFLPVLRAGETGGRLVEAFELLCRHCHRVGPSMRLVRNTWLYPLIIIGFGWILRTCIFIYFGKYEAARRTVWFGLWASMFLVLLVWLLFKTQPMKRLVDLVFLQIPIMRETELRLAVVLFFATFRLAYESGGIHVIRTFDLAWQTVRNDAIRQDLLKARGILEQNGTFGDAFEAPALLEDNIKGMMNTGSLSGQLDQSLARIVETATGQLELTLQVFNRFLQRWVAFAVAISMVDTVLMCIL